MDNVQRVRDAIPNVFLNTFGKNFTFVDREQSNKLIFDTFEEYSSLLDQQGYDIDKNNIVLPFIAAAPGVGKLRLLKEIGSSLYRKHFRECVTCYPLFVSFGNGTLITDIEKEQLSINQSLIIRAIFHSYVISMEKKKISIPF